MKKRSHDEYITRVPDSGRGISVDDVLSSVYETVVKRVGRSPASKKGAKGSV